MFADAICNFVSDAPQVAAQSEVLTQLEAHIIFNSREAGARPISVVRQSPGKMVEDIRVTGKRWEPLG